ncbi:MAG: PP2C family protein-serine/threonine phosphatase, partial [Candidatus Ornithomonoglobus sp.]
MKPEIKRPLPKKIIAEAARNIGKRNEQQDHYIYSDLYDYNECEPGALAIVADGMGGYENGKAASKLAAEKFVECYKKTVGNNVNMALIESMNYANESLAELSDGGTTLVCAVVNAWRLYWISVGDSRIYLYRNGLLRKLNIEHNYKHRLLQMAETGEITFHQALTNKKGNALTSYVGMEYITEYDYNDCEFPLLKK